MTIAIDIDGTWDRDPALFLILANTAWHRGHKVIIVTGREQPPEKLERLGVFSEDAESNLPVIVSGPKTKERAALDAGYKVDVWIDDMPGTIQECKILNERGQP